MHVDRPLLNKATPCPREIARMLQAGGGVGWKATGMAWRQAITDNLLRPLTLTEVLEALLPLGGFCPQCNTQTWTTSRGNPLSKWVVTEAYAGCFSCNLGVPSILDTIHEDLSPQRAVTKAGYSNHWVEQVCVDQASTMLQKAKGKCTGPVHVSRTEGRYVCTRSPCASRVQVGSPGKAPATYSWFGVQCPKCVSVTRGEKLPKPVTGGGRTFEPLERWHTLRLARQVYASRYRWLAADLGDLWLAGLLVGTGTFPDWYLADPWAMQPLQILQNA